MSQLSTVPRRKTGSRKKTGSRRNEAPWRKSGSRVSPASRIDELKSRARAEVDRGHLDRAMVLCDEAVELARDLGDRELLDQAICNRGGILVIQGQGERVVGELRKILLRSASAANSFQAAYVVSQFHELREERERSLFYARLALEHAEKSRVAEFAAKGNNRIANLLMLDSYFEEACAHYRQALELLPDDYYLDRALLWSNTGYCQVVLGSYNRGLKYLFRSLHLIRQRCAATWERFPCLGLSYAYLELSRLDQARIHASRALRRSELAESPEQIKNSLYLLGETEKLAGNEWQAYEHFQRLQQEFYPDQPFIIDFLMTTDIRQLINLMA